MKKRKGFLIFTLVFLAAVVFAIFYFRDPADIAAIEKKQDADAVETADDLLEDLNSSFDDIDFEEEDSLTIENDSVKSND